MNKLNPEQIKSCAQLLSQLEPGLLPLEIFNQVARLVRLSIVCIVPIKHNGNELQIGLLKRKVDDAWWPGMWHLAGTVEKSTDTITTSLERLLKKELQVSTSDAPLFRKFFDHQSERGSEMFFLYTIEDVTLESNSSLTWFSLDNLPEDFVETEKRVLKKLKESLKYNE